MLSWYITVRFLTSVPILYFHKYLIRRESIKIYQQLYRIQLYVVGSAEFLNKQIS
jgi:hypothetical protein